MLCCGVLLKWHENHQNPTRKYNQELRFDEKMRDWHQAKAKVHMKALADG